MLMLYMSQTDKVIAYYQATAGDYQRFWMSPDSLAMHFGYYDDSVRTHDASLLKMNEVLARYAQITSHDRVLDAGCGYGGSAIWLARMPGCQVTGIDIVPEQIEQAQRFACRYQVSDLAQFACMDFTRTTYADASFDVVWALESVVHIDRKGAFLQEAHRLLRQGGRLLISEYLLRDSPPLSSEEHARLAPWLEGWAMASLLTSSDYDQLFAISGFRRVQIYDLTDHIQRSVTHLGKLHLPTVPTISILLPFVRLLHAFHLLGTERVNNYYAGLCQTIALRKQLWRYMVLLAEKAEREEAEEWLTT
jgi:cyclopropane fatty-acyl-phospholipid synthase-like methyltransferase